MPEFRLDYYAIDVDSNGVRIEKRRNGSLTIHNPIIARSGVQRYRNADGTVRDEYRSPDEVFKSDSLASFAGCPLTNDHPSSFVGPDNFRQVAVGSLGDKVYRDTVNGQDVMRVSRIDVHDGSTIEDIRAGKRMLSNGYWADSDPTPGVSPKGVAYTCRQVNIIGNHCAIVDRARAGELASLPRLDSADPDAPTVWSQEIKDINMPPDQRTDAFVVRSGSRWAVRRGDPPFEVVSTFSTEEEATAEMDRLHRRNNPRPAARGNSARRRFEASKTSEDSMPRMTIDGVEWEVPEALVAPVKALAAKADKVEGERDTIKSQIDDLTKQIKALKAQPKMDAEALKARRALERKAEPFLTAEYRKDKMDDATDADLMIAAILSQDAQADLKGKTDGYLQGRFDSLRTPDVDPDAPKPRPSHRAAANPAPEGKEDGELEYMDGDAFAAAWEAQHIGLPSMYRDNDNGNGRSNGRR